MWNIDFFFQILYFTAFLNLANYKSGYLPELTKRAQIVKYKQPIKSEIITRWEIEKWHDPPSASFDNLIVDVRSFSEEFQKLRLLIMRPHNIGAVWSLSTTLTRMAYRGVTKHPPRNAKRIPAHRKQSRFSLGLEILSLTIAEILHRFESNFILLILD